VSFNVAMLKQMRAEGLDFDAAIRVLEAGEKRADPTAAERKRRQRAKAASRRDVTRDPPNDIDILTPREVSEAKASSPQPWALPVGVSLQVWTDFLTNRKRKRLPNTPTAWKSFNDDLSRVAIETGIPPPKLIELCTAKGWGAIYDPRSSKNERPANSNHLGLGKTSAAIAGLGNWDDDRPM
jgi:hypothetical protein